MRMAQAGWITATLSVAFSAAARETGPILPSAFNPSARWSHFAPRLFALFTPASKAA